MMPSREADTTKHCDPLHMAKSLIQSMCPAGGFSGPGRGTSSEATPITFPRETTRFKSAEWEACDWVISSWTTWMPSIRRQLRKKNTLIIIIAIYPPRNSLKKKLSAKYLCFTILKGDVYWPYCPIQNILGWVPCVRVTSHLKWIRLVTCVQPVKGICGATTLSRLPIRKYAPCEYVTRYNNNPRHSSTSNQSNSFLSQWSLLVAEIRWSDGVMGSWHNEPRMLRSRKVPKSDSALGAASEQERSVIYDARQQGAGALWARRLKNDTNTSK